MYEIKTIDDIINHANLIIEKVENNPFNNEVATINMSSVANENLSPSNYMGGSTAINKFIDLLKIAQKGAYERGLRGAGLNLDIVNKFKCNDIDIFILNAKKETRTKYDGIDVVHKTDSTIDEFLTNVDLPMSQIIYTMFDGRPVFWVTYHCLYSILTCKYYLPSYLINKDRFIEFWKWDLGVDELLEKFYNRINKYESRCFFCNYVDTNIKLTWLEKLTFKNY
jgi:hypothetical protein